MAEVRWRPWCGARGDSDEGCQRRERFVSATAYPIRERREHVTHTDATYIATRAA